MAKALFLLIASLILNFSYAFAQEPTSSRRFQQVQQLLGMNKVRYKAYCDSLKIYDKRFDTLLKGAHLNKSTRSAALQAVLAERRAFLQQRLNKEQRRKLAAYNQQFIDASLRKKQLQELQERLRKRGIGVVKDSLR